MNRRLFVFVVASGLAVGTGVLADRAPEKKGQRDPKELGRVVIVPFLDITGDDQEARTEFRETALAEVEERFLKHEISFVSRADAATAMKELGMNPADEEDRTKSRFKALAEKLKASWVVTGTIHDSGSGVGRRGSLGNASKEGKAKVQFRVFDAQAGQWAEDKEDTQIATSRSNAPFGGAFQRASKLRVKAVGDATKKAMDRFLAPYPKVHDSVPDTKSEGKAP
jgi:hypothetical protein